MPSGFSLAMGELAGIREKNKEEQAIRRNEIYTKLPRIERIDLELTRAGLGFSRSILSSKNNFEEIKEIITKLNHEKKIILEKNGYTFDYLDDIYNCERCKDTGFVVDKKCVCLEKIIIKHISKSSNLTEAMKEQSFENFDFLLFKDDLSAMQKKVKIAINFADTFENDGKNLFIFGSVGTGKTYLSSAISNRALERGKSVYYQTSYRLFDTVERVKFGKTNDDSEKEMMKIIYDVDLLIIDDLGTEFVTSLSTSAFFDILNARLLDKKSTIINSNLTPEEIGNMYSERVLSRIIGNYIMLTLTSGDLRVRA